MFWYKPIVNLVMRGSLLIIIAFFGLLDESGHGFHGIFLVSVIRSTHTVDNRMWATTHCYGLVDYRLIFQLDSGINSLVGTVAYACVKIILHLIMNISTASPIYTDFIPTFHL
jgi:hypothetical protein